MDTLDYSLNNLIKKLYKNDPDLNDISLSFMEISKHSFNSLCYSISHNTVIKRLSISCINLRDVQCKYLKYVLEMNKSIFFLDLSNNMIGSEGLSVLEPGFNENDTLIELNLFGNNIDDKGAYTLARILCNNKQKLHIINIRCNNITEKGIISLLYALSYNNNLFYLYYDTFKVKDETINEKIQKKLKENRARTLV